MIFNASAMTCAKKQPVPAFVHRSSDAYAAASTALPPKMSEMIVPASVPSCVQHAGVVVPKARV